MNGSKPITQTWVFKIIVINVIVFILFQFIKNISIMVTDIPGYPPVPAPFVTYFFGISGFTVVNKYYIWQFVTYLFLHNPDGFFHIAFNMYNLFLFGFPLEQTWGSRRFLFYYFFTGIGAGICIVALNTFIGGPSFIIPTIGASGAVFGILLAFGLLFPNVELMLLIPPMPIKAKYLVMIFAGIEIFFLFSGGLGNISHIGHIGGLLFGLIYFFLIKRHGLKFKTKIIKAKIQKSIEKQDNIKVKESSSNRSLLMQILKKVKKSGSNTLTDDEFQHMRYIEIMHDDNDDTCIDDDFDLNDDYCNNCDNYEACMIRLIKKYL